MNKTEAEEFTRRTAVSVSIKPVAEIGEIGVEREGVDGKHPRRHAKVRHQRAQAGHRHAVPQRSASTEVGIYDGHHPISGSRIVGTQVPAESAEVRKLPGIHDGSKHPRTWKSQQNRYTNRSSASSVDTVLSK